MTTSNAREFLEDSGVNYALALTKFWGNMVTSFRDQTVLFNTVLPDDGVGEAPPAEVIASKNVTDGNDWQFLQFGEDAQAEEHEQGTELLGQTFVIGEGTITMDENPLVVHYEPRMESLRRSHFAVLPQLGASIGRGIANEWEERMIITGLKAATAPAVTKQGKTIHNGGNIVTRTGSSLSNAYPTSATGARNLIDDLAQLARLMDEDNVPRDQRFLLTTPYGHQVLRHERSIFDADFSAQRSNDLNRRILGMVEDFNILPFTNLMPSSNITSKPESRYNGDFSVGGSGDGVPIALAMCGMVDDKASIGYVHAGGVMPTMNTDDRRGTMFLKGQLSSGAGQLHPYCAGSVSVHS